MSAGSKWGIRVEAGLQAGIVAGEVELEHRQVKYLNNRLENDHGKLKRLIRLTLGFQSMRTARATIKGFEVMRMIRQRQCT